MPARPLHCKFCRGVFLPVSEQAWSAAQCPHCSGQMKVGDCDPAVALPVSGDQEYHPVTEQEEEAARLTGKHNRWAGRMAALGTAGLVLVLAAMALQLAGGAKRQGKEIVRRPPDGSRPLPERQDVQKLAQAFLGARDWPAVLPLAADSQRVRAMMEWYYANRPWHPLAGEVRIVSIHRMEAEGREMLQVHAATTDRAAIWLLMVKEGAAWKVDWEIFADAAAARWHSFVREAPGTVVELPLLAARKPGAEAYLVEAGFAPDSHAAVVLHARDRQSLAVAVLSKESPLWKELEGIDFEKPVSVIALVSMVSPDAEPPRVSLEAIVQKGWLRRTQLPVAGDAPKQ